MKNDENCFSSFFNNFVYSKNWLKWQFAIIILWKKWDRWVMGRLPTLWRWQKSSNASVVALVFITPVRWLPKTCTYSQRHSFNCNTHGHAQTSVKLSWLFTSLPLNALSGVRILLCCVTTTWFLAIDIWVMKIIWKESLVVRLLLLCLLNDDCFVLVCITLKQLSITWVLFTLNYNYWYLCSTTMFCC